MIKKKTLKNINLKLFKIFKKHSLITVRKKKSYFVSIYPRFGWKEFLKNHYNKKIKRYTHTYNIEFLYDSCWFCLYMCV